MLLYTNTIKKSKLNYYLLVEENKKLTIWGKATIISFLSGIVSFFIKAMTEKNNFIDNKGVTLPDLNYQISLFDVAAGMINYKLE